MLTPQVELTIVKLARQGLVVKTKFDKENTISAKSGVSSSSIYAVLQKYGINSRPNLRNYKDTDLVIKQLQQIVKYDPDLKYNAEINDTESKSDTDYPVSSSMKVSKRGLPYRSRAYRHNRFKKRSNPITNWIISLFKWIKYSVFKATKPVVERAPYKSEPPINKATEGELYKIYDELVVITNKLEQSITKIYTYNDEEN